MKTCSAIWLLVLITVFMLAVQGRLGLLAVAVPGALLLACIIGRPGHESPADSNGEKQ